MTFSFQNSRRRPVKAVLFVSGDGLRVVEDETKVSVNIFIYIYLSMSEYICAFTLNKCVYIIASF